MHNTDDPVLGLGMLIGEKREHVYWTFSGSEVEVEAKALAWRRRCKQAEIHGGCRHRATWVGASSLLCDVSLTLDVSDLALLHATS
jgi:hypothetical protein